MHIDCDTDALIDNDRRLVALAERQGEDVGVAHMLGLPDELRDAEGDLLPLTEVESELRRERVDDTDGDAVVELLEVCETLSSAEEVSLGSPEVEALVVTPKDKVPKAETLVVTVTDTDEDNDAVSVCDMDDEALADRGADGLERGEPPVLPLAEKHGEALSVPQALALTDMQRDTEGDLLLLTVALDERVTERVTDADTEPLGTAEEVGETLPRADLDGLGVAEPARLKVGLAEALKDSVPRSDADGHDDDESDRLAR